MNLWGCDGVLGMNAFIPLAEAKMRGCSGAVQWPEIAAAETKQHYAVNKSCAFIPKQHMAQTTMEQL